MRDVHNPDLEVQQRTPLKSLQHMLRVKVPASGGFGTKSGKSSKYVCFFDITTLFWYKFLFWLFDVFGFQPPSTSHWLAVAPFQMVQFDTQSGLMVVSLKYGPQKPYRHEDDIECTLHVNALIVLWLVLVTSPLLHQFAMQKPATSLLLEPRSPHDCEKMSR